jgi:hypothetical protein
MYGYNKDRGFILIDAYSEDMARCIAMDTDPNIDIRDCCEYAHFLNGGY